ncbi:hypothetical protein PUN28_015536 [Cardiocondyla obscurior]|uniref:WAP domain-containing protein n=1 Tax=Cardiocondyla obscurior TaxID=286306 RepID=A0AAW2EX31_9HYME
MDRKLLCLLSLCFIFTEAYTNSCKYWCKMRDHQYYCCPNGESDTSAFESKYNWYFHLPWFRFVIGVESHIEEPWHESMTMWKPKKHCPPLRAQCPRSHEWYKPPKHCDADHECEENEKCCFDVCLEHKTCKDAE